MLIEYLEQKDKEELDATYPEGSYERSVLDYSRSSHKDEEVHPMLRTAFWILMGLTSVMAISAMIGFSQAK